MTNQLKLFFNWIQGYCVGDPSRNGEYRFLRGYLRDEMTIFDVGANTGEYSQAILAMACAIQLHCFEPVATTFSELTKRLANCVGADCLHLNPYGLSDKVETRMIKIYGELAGSNSLYERKSAVEFDSSFCTYTQQAVSLITLDKYVADNEITQIDWLKIDVEGHELRVLQGAINSLSQGIIKGIQFEYGGCFLDSLTKLEDVCCLLMRFGYHLYRLTPYGKVRVNAFKSSLENYKYSNWIALLS